MRIRAWLTGRGAAGRVARRDAASLQRGRNPAAPPGLAEPLTGRELEVLRLLAAGRSNQRIAHDLVVALDTVKST
jgi:ATP/maltotriose-dependent transcriptional regulator MalT